MRSSRALPPAVLVTALALVLAACAGGEDEDGSEESTSTQDDETPSDDENPSDDEPADPAALDAHVAAVSDLGAELAATAEDESLVVSPASAATMLAILAAGAEGETLAELETLLGGGSSDVLASIGDLRAVRADLEVDPAAGDLDPWPDSPVLHLADQVAVREGVTPGDAWLTSVEGLGAEVVEASPDELPGLLDEWVALHTGGLVEESAITPDASTGLVVQDAVLLHASFEPRFSGSATEDLPFTLADGSEVTVPTMRAERPLPWAETEVATATSLDLEGGLDVQVVLPAEGTAPSELTAEDWNALDDALTSGDEALVDLGLPRADLATTTNLMSALPGLGAESFADGGGELGGIFEGAFVDEAVQQATLEVTEQGVVAAAVSETDAAGAIPPPPETRELIVDRPYALRVVDGETGWVLVHAVVADPRGEG
ncbi:serpin family protein [Georgenia sp. Z1344]|uniref:serpin family protein n=1 Tax=Georgenia sp. Z1344 TaxID=3416706 RepID=UPI003CFAD639